jgi:porin
MPQGKGMGKLVNATLLSTFGILFLLASAIAGDVTPTNIPHKSGYDNEEGFSAPGSTSRQLEEDDEVKSPVLTFLNIEETLQPWFDFKKELNERHGLQLGLAYTTTYQKADETLPGNEDEAMTGVFRISGKWALFNRGQKNKGSLVFSVDNRSRMNDVAASDFASEIGYIGPTATLFSGVDTVLVDLHWQQYLNDGNTGLLIGRYDPNDFMHVLGYANPWTTFQNINILFDSSVAYSDYGLGVGIGHWFENQYYVKAGFNDANGRVDELEIYNDGAEFFKFAEVGWSPSRDERYLKNIHLFAWHVDERDKDELDDAHGIAIGANWTWDKTWMLFGKAGWSDAGAVNDPQIYKESYTVGSMYYFANRSDLAGVAVNWGKLAAPGLDSQTTTEMFYRLQLAQNLAITPSLQLLQDPALNAQDDSILIMGVRIRLSL